MAVLAARRTSAAIAGVLLAASGCDLFHSTDWKSACDLGTAACDAAGGAGAGTPAGAGGAGGEGGDIGTNTGGGSSTSSSPTSSSSTGGDPVCGDGFIDAGEQCDDTNDIPTDGCDVCVVVCNGPNEVLDPATLNCYLHDPLAGGSWSAVRSSCVAWGGDLAAISSAAEQSFVQTFLSTSSWIGGTDSVAEGTFGWTNGEAFAYTNWNPGEPNDTNANEDCVEIYGPGIATAPFLWNDLLCDTVKPAVCERAPAGI